MATDELLRRALREALDAGNLSVTTLTILRDCMQNGDAMFAQLTARGVGSPQALMRAIALRVAVAPQAEALIGLAVLARIAATAWGGVALADTAVVAALEIHLEGPGLPDAVAIAAAALDAEVLVPVRLSPAAVDALLGAMAEPQGLTRRRAARLFVHAAWHGEAWHDLFEACALRGVEDPAARVAMMVPRMRAVGEMAAEKNTPALAPAGRDAVADGMVQCPSYPTQAALAALANFACDPSLRRFVARQMPALSDALAATRHRTVTHLALRAICAVGGADTGVCDLEHLNWLEPDWSWAAGVLHDPEERMLVELLGTATPVLPQPPAELRRSASAQAAYESLVPFQDEEEAEPMSPRSPRSPRSPQSPSSPQSPGSGKVQKRKTLKERRTELQEEKEAMSEEAKKLARRRGFRDRPAVDEGPRRGCTFDQVFHTQSALTSWARMVSKDYAGGELAVGFDSPEIPQLVRELLAQRRGDNAALAFLGLLCCAGDEERLALTHGESLRGLLQVAWSPPGPASGLAGLVLHVAGLNGRLPRVLAELPKGSLGRLLTLPLGLPLLYSWTFTPTGGWDYETRACAVYCLGEAGLTEIAARTVAGVPGSADADCAMSVRVRLALGANGADLDAALARRAAVVERRRRRAARPAVARVRLKTAHDVRVERARAEQAARRAREAAEVAALKNREPLSVEDWSCVDRIGVHSDGDRHIRSLGTFELHADNSDAKVPASVRVKVEDDFAAAYRSTEQVLSDAAWALGPMRRAAEAAAKEPDTPEQLAKEAEFVDDLRALALCRAQMDRGEGYAAALRTVDATLAKERIERPLWWLSEDPNEEIILQCWNQRITDETPEAHRLRHMLCLPPEEAAELEQLYPEARTLVGLSQALFSERLEVADAPGATSASLVLDKPRMHALNRVQKRAVEALQYVWQEHAARSAAQDAHADAGRLGASEAEARARLGVPRHRRFFRDDRGNPVEQLPEIF